MKTPTIVKTTKDYLLVKIPLPQRAAPKRAKQDLTAEQVLKIVAEGEREYRSGKIKPIRSLRELRR